MQETGGLLVIGARSLIGRRLRDVVSGPEGWSGDVRFTSRQLLANQSLILNFDTPEAFQPGLVFPTVIVCAPIWLVTEKLINHMVSLGMRRLVAFSSTSVFTKDDSDSAEEREVVQKLRQGEKSTIDYCESQGVAWTILRPTLIYDEGNDENVTQLASMIRKLGFFPICAPANGLRQPVHARDLAIAALQAARAPAAHNKAYDVPGGESLTYRAMVERIYGALQRKPSFLALPEGLWRFGFAVLDALQPKKRLKRNVNMVLRMNRDLWFDASTAHRDFGYAPAPFKPDFSN